MARQVLLALFAVGFACFAANGAPSLKGTKSEEPKSTAFKNWGFMDAYPLWVDIATMLRFLGDYKFVDLLEDADIYTNLSTEGPYTVFAPNNMPFILSPFPDRMRLYNKTYAAMVGNYHVVEGEHRLVSFENDMLVPTVLGPNLRFNVYHSGWLRTVNGKPLAYGEFKANNGFVQQLNDILMDIPTQTIKEIVGNSSTLTVLYQALNNSDMLSLLDGPAPFTLFAPTDDVFAQLPPGVVDKWLLNITLLTDVVKYHIVSSTYFSIGLEVGQLEAISGKSLKIVPNFFTGLTINGANITRQDVIATNGVIQEIDGFLSTSVVP